MSRENLSDTVTIVGGGLAGAECALQLARRGKKVHLYEMRGIENTPAHQTQDFAELVCSNSFGTEAEISAPGELKFEAMQLGSFVLQAAKEARVPAGQALAMDRGLFSKILTKLINQNPKIQTTRKVIRSIRDLPRPLVIATGPLTHPDLAKEIQELIGSDLLYFFDAIAPVVDADSINWDKVWRADRYDKGTPDYLNCPLSKEEYNRFVEAVHNARKVEPKDFETTDFFEGCMPIEVMVERGPQTLRFGPMKPVGLKDPRAGREPWAVVQLRQENRDATAYNLVGFQTRMTYGEQTRVFRMIPGLESAEFLKLGSLHRNLFINSPTCLREDLSCRMDSGIYFAGQITGVEGYFESACMGLMVALSLDQQLRGKPFDPPPRASALGSLLAAILAPERAKYFQPINMNFGLFPPLTLTESGRDSGRVDKKKKKEDQIMRARSEFGSWLQSHQFEAQESQIK